MQSQIKDASRGDSAQAVHTDMNIRLCKLKMFQQN